jgi:hypothetical protein
MASRVLEDAPDSLWEVRSERVSTSSDVSGGETTTKLFSVSSVALVAGAYLYFTFCFCGTRGRGIFVFYFLFFCLLVDWDCCYFLDRIGHGPSTPLSFTLDHWREVKTRAHNLSVDVKKNKWITLCLSGWPTFQTGWPPEGSFSLPLILAIKRRIFGVGLKSHPDQFPYIIVWEDLVTDPTLWVCPFVSFSGL